MKVRLRWIIVFQVPTGEIESLMALEISLSDNPHRKIQMLFFSVLAALFKDRTFFIQLSCYCKC